MSIRSPRVAAVARLPFDLFRHTNLRAVAGVALVAYLAGCGGGSGGEVSTSPQTPAPAPAPAPAPVPGQKWLTLEVKGRGVIANSTSDLSCASSCRIEFLSSAVLTLRAEPGAGETFQGWGGACSGMTTTCTVRLDQDTQVTASFTANVQPQWLAAQTVSHPGADAPTVAVDALGGAVAAWLQGTAGSATRQLNASVFAGGRWAAPVRVDAGSGDVSGARLAIDATSGRGVIVWRQLGAGLDLWAATYSPGGAWSAPIALEQLPGAVGLPRVGIDNQGRALAVWEQIAPNGRISIYAARYTPADGWAPPTLLKVNDALGATEADPELAVATNGSALAVWKRADGVSGRLWASQYTPSAGWGPAVEVVPDGGTGSTIGGHALAVDATGNGLLVWGQWDLSQGAGMSRVKFKRFSAGTWLTAVSDVAPPVASRAYVSQPVVAMNTKGAAVVAWAREDGSVMAASASQNVAAFGTAVAVRAPRTLALNATPVLSLDATGRAFLAWTDNDLWLSERDAAGTWSPAAQHETLPEQAAAPALAMSADGSAMLAWRQFIAGEGTRILARQHKLP